MTESVRKFLGVLRAGDYKKKRIDNRPYDMTEELKKHPSRLKRIIMLEDMLKSETPNLLDGDIFGFNRSQIEIPGYKRDNGKMARGSGGNFTPNYIRIVSLGFDGIRAEIDRCDAHYGNPDKTVFYDAMRRALDVMEEMSERYRTAAEEAGNTRLAEALRHVPKNPARSFYEACLFLKILTYMLRCGGGVHMTFGRFDQYMYEYYKADRARGISNEELLETLELFFISLNVDGDLYIGVQQGDNGQSMVLGGYDKDGNDQFNELSALCMDASLELSLIDPKINLRVSKKTPDSMYEYGTKLTKQGLGFPQYCNDDIVVPFLISLGYDEEDAWNYTVAACWEHIIPNCGVDVPNIGTMNFPLVVSNAIHKSLLSAKTFDDLMESVRGELRQACDDMRELYRPKNTPNPDTVTANILSLFIDGCIEQGLDYTAGAAKYNNFGSHGAGIANAADALIAVKTLVYEEKSVQPEVLLSALDADFVGYNELQNRLLGCPKMGNNDDRVDLIACDLMDTFTAYLNNKPNGKGGIWRCGTGSAMEYIKSARKCPATADGRNAGAPFGSSFSPAITTRLYGPLSVIRSFTKFDLKRIANGGPLTMEVHDTVFRNEEGEKKVAQLLKAFVHLGGHQLQLNSINRDRLLDAQEHPENYPNLIVRVWGWSGYFCELDREYQDHIIARTEFTV